jgi:hypothetical protein
MRRESGVSFGLARGKEQDEKKRKEEESEREARNNRCRSA